MTAPSGPILFNNSTGSDTAASGLGPSTAVSGTGGATDGTTTVDLSADTPDLSGVAAGDLMWIATTSGQQFSIIASVDDGADTVTCDVAFSTTEGSLNWGIGGKRLDLEGSAAIYADPKPGWVIDIEETGTGYDITTRPTISCSGDTTDGKIIFKSSSVIRPAINIAHTVSGSYGITISGSHLRFDHIKIDQTTNTNLVTAMIGASGFASDLHFKDCELTEESSTNRDRFFINPLNLVTVGIIFEDCYIHDTGAIKCANVQGRTGVRIERCYFKDITGTAIEIEDEFGAVIRNNVIDTTTIRGIQIKDNCAGAIISGNLIYAAGTDGIGIVGTGPYGSAIRENVVVNSGEHGIQVDAAPGGNEVLNNDHNAFFNNTSGEITGIANGDNDITLTADPFIDAAGGDFNLNNVAGGGVALRTATVTLPS